MSAPERIKELAYKFSSDIEHYKSNLYKTNCFSKHKFY